MNKIILVSKLNIGECRKRLSEDIRGGVISGGLLEGGNFYGHVEEYEFNICTQKGYHSNSFTPIFYAKLIDNNGQTLIDGRFRWRLIVRLFVLLVTILLFVASVLIMNIVPIILVLFMVPFMLIGYGIGKSDEVKILDFLQKKLEADLRASETR